MKNLIKNMILSIWDNKVHFFSLILLFLISLSLTWGVFSANLSFSETLGNWNMISNSSDAILDLNASTFFSHKKTKDQLATLKDFLKSIDNNIKISLDPELKQVTFTFRDYRTFYDHKNIKKALLIPYDINNSLNQYYINNKVDKIFFNNFSSCNYKDNHCVVLSTQYAQKNNIKVGDIVDFNNFFRQKDQKNFRTDPSTFSYKFKVNGFANSFDVTFPKIDLVDTVPQTKNSEICYLDYKFLLNEQKDNFQTSSFSDRDQILLFHFPDGVDHKKFSQLFYDKIISNIWNFQGISFPNKFSFPTLGYYDRYNDSFTTNNLWYSRTTTFNYFVDYENKISLIFLVAINATIFFVIAIIARKRIDIDENNILIFKSLGFKKKSITFVYSFYPLVFAIFLSIFALGISFLFQKLLFSVINNFFMVNIEKVAFSWVSFVIDVCFYSLVIAIFTFISVYFLIRKKMAKSI